MKGHRRSEPLLRSFPPVADSRSRILVLGTMPGPEALRRGEYYGFPGNHFWKIMSALFAGGRHMDYEAKIRLLKRNGIALWDVLASCRRTGAADSAIRDACPTDVPGLLERHPRIRRVYLNGKACERLYLRHFASRVRLPAVALPSTSPAHASMNYDEKLRRWSLLKEHLRQRGGDA